MCFPFSDYHQKEKGLWKIGGLLYFLDTTNHGLRHALLKAKNPAYPTRDQNHEVIQIEEQCPQKGLNWFLRVAVFISFLFVLIFFFKFCFSYFFPKNLTLSLPLVPIAMKATLAGTWHLFRTQESLQLPGKISGPEGPCLLHFGKKF